MLLTYGTSSGSSAVKPVRRPHLTYNRVSSVMTGTENGSHPSDNTTTFLRPQMKYRFMLQTRLLCIMKFRKNGPTRPLYALKAVMSTWSQVLLAVCCCCTAPAGQSHAATRRLQPCGRAAPAKAAESCAQESETSLITGWWHEHRVTPPAACRGRHFRPASGAVAVSVAAAAAGWCRAVLPCPDEARPAQLRRPLTGWPGGTATLRGAASSAP
jgi:hypothetical protein